MKYENRIVLFLDILGFKYIIDKTTDKEEDNEKHIKKLYEDLSEIGNFCKSQLKGDNHSVKVTQFSDSIIVSFLDDDNEAFLNLIRTIQELIMKLVNNGNLCRGAISYGKLIHKPRVIFGPALNEAYETETNAALYPRVILDRSIIKLGKKSNQKDLIYEFMDHRDAVLSYLKQDTDDKLYMV